VFEGAVETVLLRLLLVVLILSRGGRGCAIIILGVIIREGITAACDLTALYEELNDFEVLKAASGTLLSEAYHNHSCAHCRSALCDRLRVLGLLNLLLENVLH
jgi:Putative Phosphatase